MLLCIVLISSSSVYASGISKAPLSKWYGQLFQEESEVKGYYKSLDMTNSLEDFNSFALESSNSITTTTENIVENQIQKSKSSIKIYHYDMNHQLGQTVADLESVNFDNYIEEMKIKEKIDLEISSILTEIFND